jgi:hypothetical protein
MGGLGALRLCRLRDNAFDRKTLKGIKKMMKGHDLWL